MNRKDYPVFKLLEKKSKFFCPAKWNELYLYLNHGNSNSCHHPIPHAIPADQLADPFVLHNTPHKLKMQQLMIDGHRPQECHMCWHVEDLNDTVVSDRILKSVSWQDQIETLKVDPHHVPEFIEVVFDNYCNLTCSYCDSGQSSSWAAKVRKDPLDLVTDQQRQLYSKIHIDPGTIKDEYYQAWLVWWKQIDTKVNTLKISGGEPLLSKNFWQFFDILNKTPNLQLCINSNLSVKQELIDKFICYTDKFKQVNISASIDAVGDIAEYARQGLDYQQFVDNLEYWLSNSDGRCTVNLQSTVSILNIWGITDKFDLSIKLRQQYPNKVKNFYSTLVRFPEFQSLLILPDHLKSQLSSNIQSWHDQNRKWLTEPEQSYVNKIITYLKTNPEAYGDFSLQQLTVDFKKFLVYYDSTSKIKYKKIYNTEFLQWIDSIDINENSHNYNSR